MKLTQEERDWLTLSLVPGVGTAHFIRLLARFRTPGSVLKARRDELRDLVGDKLAERIVHYADAVDAPAQERAMEMHGASLVTLESPRYPLKLAEIYDPPLMLFVRGSFLEEDEPFVAIVGTRRASPYGLRMAEKLGRELAARGITVVSGMAAGIDGAAHRGALEAGGRTVAVLGCGVDVVFPPQHEDLMHQISAQGAVVSQYPMGTKPLAGNFPYRNRIISGMSLGTIVVEAPLKSGALITARQAGEQGREVFAVPGQVGMVTSEGPHALLREGARLVESVQDVIVELELPAHCLRGPKTPSAERAETRETPAAATLSAQPAPVAHPPMRKAEPEVTAGPKQAPKSNASDLERSVLSVLSPNGSYVDEIAMACRISVSEALSSLTLLELKGLVKQFSGKRFAPR